MKPGLRCLIFSAALSNKHLFARVELELYFEFFFLREIEQNLIHFETIET